MRKLKAEKADKTTIDGEVTRLLALKAQILKAQGGPSPAAPAASAGQKKGKKGKKN